MVKKKNATLWHYDSLFGETGNMITEVVFYGKKWTDCFSEYDLYIISI